ncbi:SPOR domain-containing protein [Crenobacter intestini]|uniref:SPOR domain-containing protein n=1 Tax=Crenobacter intestini TaxID=2563443 RepID=A0A4T0UTH8_9NEIS|nr:SPOR domain-containing protein [Crenobacter intestini]TIC82299.1 SPOR domain-containing protein [Crenobacter intestini]
MKKRIAIAAALALAALASIPLLERKPAAPGEEQAASGRLSGPLPVASEPLPAPELSASAPLVASAPSPGLPVGPATESTPGLASTPPLMVEAVVPQAKAVTSRATETPAPAATPRAVAASTAPQPAKAATVPPRADASLQGQPAASRPQGSSFGYSVQLGLFSNIGNAEKLVDELKAKGIAAKTETRIQLGPFTTRTEAEDAMARLRALGYTPLLIPLGQ